MQQQLSTELSVYEALVQGRALDLLSPHWVQAHEHGANPNDYSQTQVLGQWVRNSESKVQWIRCASARAEGRYEQWHCHATRGRVSMSNDLVCFDF